MTDQVRFEHAERVRDFYREQGAAKERERIIQLIEKIKSAPACFELDVDALIGVIKGETK